MPRDYYPVLARAIAGLEENTAELRQTIYDHARAVLVWHMRDLDAGLSVGLGELDALEEAILKVESEAVGPEQLKHVSIDESLPLPSVPIFFGNKQAARRERRWSIGFRRRPHAPQSKAQKHLRERSSRRCLRLAL